jgi:hypothetical protein
VPGPGYLRTTGSALDAVGGLTVAADRAEKLVCPAARHRKLRQLAELVAYTGLASESRDLARAGRAEDHVPNRSRPFRARPIGDAQKLNSKTWTVKEDR